MSHSHPQHDKSASSFQLDRKLKVVGIIFLLVLAISYLPFPFLTALHKTLVSYISMIWWAILLGLVLGGLIEYFVPTEFVSKYLGEKSLRSLFYAVVSGFLLSACSHGILALAIELHKKGANNGSVITFLLAAPWANLPVTILLFGFFGLKAFLFIGAAMLIALITGRLYLLLESMNLIEPSPSSPSSSEDVSWDKFKNFNPKEALVGVSKGVISLTNMVLWWILLGFLVAAVIGAYVPHSIFMNYFGPSLKGIILTLLVATIIEVCSEGSAPIAFEIYKQVGTIGNPFVFLMAGVATDYTEIGLLWTNVGKRVAIWLPILTVPQVLLVGYAFNWFLGSS
ncbi:MAG: permease [Bdellovibrionales bacterium]|nr:permease [Bdellovibrionales bacterium]